MAQVEMVLTSIRKVPGSTLGRNIRLPWIRFFVVFLRCSRQKLQNLLK